MERIVGNKVCIGAIMSELMAKKKVKHRDIANATGIKEITLYHWNYLDKRPTTGPDIDALAKYFGVSLEYLLYGVGLSGDEKDEIIKKQQDRLEKLSLDMRIKEEEAKAQLDMFRAI